MMSGDGAGEKVRPGLMPTSGAHSSLVELLRTYAGNRPEKVAYTFSADGNSPSSTETRVGRLTYAALDGRARSIAAWLQARGLQGERVLLVFPPGLEFVSAFFGCLYAGAIAVPASMPRPNRPMNRLASIVDDARPAALLTSSAMLPSARQWLAQIPALADMQWLGVEAVPDELANRWHDPEVRPNTLAFLQYTSGSTAVPKGVMVSHGNLLHNSELITQSFGANAESRGVFWLPLFHDMGLIGGVVQTLYCGGTSTLMSPVSFLQRPLRWLNAISTTGATISGGPNFAYDLCVRKITEEQKKALDLSRWSVAFNGAEPIRAETIERFSEAFAVCGFRREAFLPCYGLAESTLMVSGKRNGSAPQIVTFRASDLDRNAANPVLDGTLDARALVGSGRVFDGLIVEIVDPETAVPKADGLVGEIWVRGASVAAGYWNRAGSTDETLGARLLNGDGPFLRTGDLGFLRDGELFVTGRIKDLMIVRGRNVYPQDVEWTASSSHPLARAEGTAAFTVAIDGEESLVVVQEIDRPGKNVDPSEIAHAIRRAVSEHHDLDVHSVCLIKALGLPKTSSGKVQRQTCRESFLSGTLETILTSSRESVSPRLAETHEDLARPATEIERWLVDRIATLLGADATSLDVRRPFAHFGLSSLQAVELAGDLETWLGRRLSPTLVYDYPTIDALARHLAGDSETPLAIDSRSPEACEPIAIIGIGCRFPGVEGPDEFWRLLSDGIDAVGEVPNTRRAPGMAGATRAGFLENVDRFDADFFGIAPREAVFIDPQQRLLLEVAWEAIEDAGIDAERLRGGDVGVFVGISSNDYGRNRLGSTHQREAYAATGNALSVAANRISYAFDFRGPSLSVDTACSSSLVALHLACESLRRGEGSLALAAGVSVILSEEVTETFREAGFLAADGRCKAFDASADGYVRGEGAGVVVLKPLARAIHDGDPIYAVIRGSAVNQDGRSNGLTAPNRDAQESVLRAAYRRAGVKPGEVDYVEAHGTGTLLGDPIEATALAAVVGTDRRIDEPCAIGSVKSNIGHLEAAAGIAGVIKVALAMARGSIPKSLHFHEPNPHIAFDTLPIRVQTNTIDWPDRQRSRLAGVSAFGFGGTNAHVVLEAAPVRVTKEVDGRPTAQLLPLSGQTPQALIDAGRSLRDLLAGHDAPRFPDVAHIAGVRRSHHDYRVAIVAQSNEEAVGQLDALLRGDLTAGRRALSRRPRCAFVYSGQGSQWWGMGRGLAESEPIVRETLNDLDGRFQELLGWSILEELAADESRCRFDQTGIGQPVVFALQIALTALWKSWGIEPDVVVGHSLGEIAAAHTAGVLGLDDAVLIVAHRARLMQTTVGQGKTAAIALPAEELAEWIAADPDRLALACLNAPGQSVISGETSAVLELVKTFKARGVFAKVLAGDCAFHSPQMDPLCEELISAIARIKPADALIPIVSSVTGTFINGPDLNPAYWAQNLRQTVRFADAAATLSQAGYDAFLEIGPHPALHSALSVALEGQTRSAVPLASLRRHEDARKTLLTSLGALYTKGFSVTWSLVASAGDFCRLPHYPFQRERFWLDLRSQSTEIHHNNGNGYAKLNGNGTHPSNGQTTTEFADFYEVEWIEQSIKEFRPVDRSAATWIVFEDGRGVGKALGTSLLERGGRCVSVLPGKAYEYVDETTFRVDPFSPADLRALLANVAADGPIAGLIHLWNLDAPSNEELSAENLIEAQRVGCESLRALVRVLGEFEGTVTPRLWVVTAGAQALGATGESLSIAQAPVWGLGKSVAITSPEIWRGLIDLDKDIRIKSVVNEILSGSIEDQVAYRGGKRFVPRLVRRPNVVEHAGRLSIRAEGTYLITGGLGSLGLRVARSLVEQGARRLVLIGRQGLPARSEWDDPLTIPDLAKTVAAVRELERLGATVFVASVDVADREAMSGLFSELNRLFPPIRGVIHAAGLVESRVEGADEFEAFENVLRPKIAGTWLLHEQTLAEPLDFFVMFSSIASVLGAKDAGYSAANQFLDAFAHYRRTLGLPALSINWGSWDQSGMATVAGRSRAHTLLGFTPLKAEVGLNALVSLAADGTTQAIVADVDWDVVKGLYGSTERPLLERLTSSPRHDEENLAGLSTFEWRGKTVEESRERLLTYLRDRLSAVLKLEPGRIDTERPIDTMGLDSLMAIELKNGVETDLGSSLPLASLLQGPTLEHLADRMLDQLNTPGENESPWRLIRSKGEESSQRSESTLSYGQRALWSLHQIAPESTAYNMIGAVRISGLLDTEILKRSAQRLVDRHASLRATFPSSGGEPIQVIHSAATVAFSVEDVSGAGAEELSYRIDKEAHRPFDLERGPLFRMQVFRKSNSEHVFLLTLHHIVADFWSIAVLLDELSKIYPAERRGDEPGLPVIPVSYPDFARWQSEIVDGLEGEPHWSYWQQQLAGPLPVLALPADRPRPPVQTSRGAARLVHIDTALASRLSALGLRRGASLYTTLLAAFQVLLSRLSGQDDVIVGSPVVGRNRPELAGVVGYFVNPLPVRTKIDPGEAFVDLLDRVRATVLGALEHQDIPFAALADRFQTVRDPSQSPVFQVMFVLQKAQRLEEKGFTSFALGGEGTRMELGGFPVESIAVETRSTQFDLTVQVAEDSGRLAVSAVYNTDLFDASTIDRLLGHYLVLLDAVAADPHRLTGELPLLTQREINQFARWNETRQYIPSEVTFPALLEHQASQNPDTLAVAAADGSLSYRELNERANRLARKLRGMGVGPGVRVAVCAERSCAVLVGILGVLKAGGAYIPLDPDYPAERLSFMISDSRAAVLLVQDRLRSRLPASEAAVISLDEDIKESSGDLEPIAGPDDLAYMIYTSGSTGAPKGVLVTRGNLAASTFARFRYYEQAVSRFLMVSSFAFDSSVAGLFWTLGQGGTIVLPAPGEHSDPIALSTLIRSQTVTHMLSVPSLYGLILENAANGDLESLNTVIVAGETCPRDLPGRHNSVLPLAALYNEYGPTEATVWATVHRCVVDDEDQGAVPIGRPIANTRVHVLDSLGQMVPVGVTGELYIGGDGVANGYHGRPGLTSERFVADKFSSEPGARLYRTGDLARFRPDGVIECLGRRDGQVKVRGYRVELGEVESVLAANPDVREAAAQVKLGSNGEAKLIGFVVPRTGAELSAIDLRSWMGSRLPDAMIPSLFAILDALPHLPNGKVDRSALPDPSTFSRTTGQGADFPRNRIEDKLARITAELLDVERVGIHDNFFEMGIDSIIAIQIVAKARRLGVQFTPTQLFGNPTVAGLANLASEVTGTETRDSTSISVDTETLQRLRRDGLDVEDAYPLTPMQEGMLVHALYSSGAGEYVQQLTCLVRGAIDPSAFEQAWRQLFERHAVLRSGFAGPGQGRPAQAVYRDVTTPFEVVDWRDLGSDEQQRKFEDALRIDREQGFAPASPPLSRVALYRLDDETTRLVWSYHHLLFDGWSLQVILGELLSVYQGVVSGRPIELPWRAPFRDYVDWVKSRDTARSEPFWRALLKGFRTTTSLRLEASGESQPDGAEPYDEQDLVVPASTTAALIELGRKHGLTLSTIAQGAWALLLGRYSGRDDVVFGSTVSGRSAPIDGVDGMVGLLINTLPVRAQIDAKAEVVSWLAKLQEQLVEARSYEDTPLTQVQSWSEIPRGRPLFESVFVFENYPVDDSLRERAGGLGFGQVRVFERTHVPLTIMAFPGPRLRLRVIYDARRFDAASVDRLIGHLGCLLDAIAEAPHQSIGSLPILSAEETRQILDQWNEPSNGRASYQSVGKGNVQATPGVDVERLSDEDVEALIGEYLGLGGDEISDE